MPVCGLLIACSGNVILLILLAAVSSVSVFGYYAAFGRGSSRGLEDAAVNPYRRGGVEAVVFDDTYRPDYVGRVAVLDAG